MVQRLSHSTRSPTRQWFNPADLRPRRIGPQLVQQRFGLVQGQAIDIGHAAAAEIQHGSPRLRMPADQRMQMARRLPRIVGRRHAGAEIAATVVGAVMLHLEPLHSGAKRGGQRLIGGVHAGEMRIAAGGRDLQRIEHGGLRWLRQVGHVGVPHRLPGAEAADGLAIRPDHIGDDVEFRLALDEAAPVLLDRRPVEFPEEPAEADQLIRAQALIPEEQDGMIQPGAVNGFELTRRQPAQVNAADLGAKGGASGHNLDAGAEGAAHPSLPFAARGGPCPAASLSGLTWGASILTSESRLREGNNAGTQGPGWAGAWCWRREPPGRKNRRDRSRSWCPIRRAPAWTSSHAWSRPTCSSRPASPSWWRTGRAPPVISAP